MRGYLQVKYANKTSFKTGTSRGRSQPITYRVKRKCGVFCWKARSLSLILCEHVGVRASSFEPFFLFFLGKKPTTFEAPSYYFHENKTFATHFYLSKRGVKNVWTAKTTSGIVLADLALLFSRKKLNKKNSPQLSTPIRRWKIMTAKILLGIVYVDSSLPFSRKKWNQKFHPQIPAPKKG